MSNMSSASKNLAQGRILWIDVFRAIIIIFVVVGHLTTKDIVHNFIYSFHLYAFYFISGIVYKFDINTSFKQYFIKIFKQLYIPYVFFSALWIVFYDLYNVAAGNEAIRNLNDILLRILKACATILYGTSDVFGADLGAIWFLLSLFTIKIIYMVLKKATKSNILIITIICIGLFIAGYFLRGFSALPFSICSSLTAFIFFHLGVLLKPAAIKFATQNPLIKIIICIFCFVFCLVGAYYMTPLSLAGNQIPNNVILLIITSSCGILFVLTLSMLISYIKTPSKQIAFLGINSLIIMGVHSELRFIVLYCLYQFRLQQPIKNTIVVFATILICIPICLFLNKYFPVLVGKKSIKGL